MFLDTGRHPLVGLFLGYAAVGGGYGTNFIPGGWDVILTTITIQSAKLLDPAFDVNLVSGYYMMAVGTVLIALTATFVTVKFIEPKFGKYEESYAATEENEGALTEVQQRALRKALLGVGLFLAAIIIAEIPSNSFLRSDTGSLTISAPLMKLLYAFLVIAFLLAGIIYGAATGKIRNIKELADMLTKSISNVAPFVVIAMIIVWYVFALPLGFDTPSHIVLQ